MCHNMKMLEKLIIGRRSSGQYFGYDLDPILTYCYGGLRKKLDVEAPSLPEIDVSVSQQKVRLKDTRYRHIRYFEGKEWLQGHMKKIYL